MDIEIEWRIPWDDKWDVPKKVKAAEKLVSYMREGKFFDRVSSMEVVEARVVQMNPSANPFIILRLEV